jgi:NAD(P)-dependent dehydrogenase (short-subunit alcohol dehydrogenase family)
MRSPQALVTGVSVGIGRAIAARLAAEGYEIHGTYLGHEREANELAAELPALALHRVDLTAGDGVQRLLDQLPQGRLDALVNNAGIAPEEPLDRFEPEIWQRTVAINLMAPVALTRAGLPATSTQTAVHGHRCRTWAQRATRRRATRSSPTIPSPEGRPAAARR